MTSKGLDYYIVLYLYCLVKLNLCKVYPSLQLSQARKSNPNPIVQTLVDLPNCVPVLNAYPLPEIPPEIANLTITMNTYIENFQKAYKMKVSYDYYFFSILLSLGAGMVEFLWLGS